MAELMSLAEMATVYGLNGHDLKRALLDKIIVPVEWGSQGIAHRFDPKAVAKALGLKLKAPKTPTRNKIGRVEVAHYNGDGRPVEVAETFQSAKARKMAADADAAELAMEVQRGSLIDIASVDRVVNDEYTRIRTNLRAIPDKIALQLEAANGVRQINRILAEAIDDALRELSSGPEVRGKSSTIAEVPEHALGDPDDAEAAEEPDGQ